MFNQYEKEILKRIKSIKKYDSWAVFSDLMSLAAYGIRLTVERGNPKAVESFEAIKNKYSKEDFENISVMFDLFINALEKRFKIAFVDVAGMIFNELNLSNKNKGQFFTPQNVADLNAQIAITKELADKEIKEYGFMVVRETACGSGTMILSTATILKKLGYNPQEKLLVYASDMDVRCVNMVYTQLSLYGIPAVVTHEDSLEGKAWDKWRTMAYLNGEWAVREIIRKARVTNK